VKIKKSSGSRDICGCKGCGVSLYHIMPKRVANIGAIEWKSVFSTVFGKHSLTPLKK
jgi:hypothetical protein